MAFQDLVNGDCSGVNPMSKFVGHMNQDHSLQRASPFFFPLLPPSAAFA